MNQRQLNAVYDWHRTVARLQAAAGHTVSELERLHLYAKLLQEEANEVALALNGLLPTLALDAQYVERAQLAKELADVLFVVLGIALFADIPIATALHVVTNSNNTKLTEPSFSPEGKLNKGSAYVNPLPVLVDALL